MFKQWIKNVSKSYVQGVGFYFIGSCIGVSCIEDKPSDWVITSAKMSSIWPVTVPLTILFSNGGNVKDPIAIVGYISWAGFMANLVKKILRLR